MGATQTRLDRFEWVIEMAVKKGARRPFDRLIGANEGHTAVIVQRMREDPDGAGLDSVTLARVTRATGANPAWILFGEEPRRIDVVGGDPELATFLATLSDNESLKAAAYATHGRLSEVKALLAMHATRAQAPLPTLEGGTVDWAQALLDYRSGKLRPKFGDKDSDLRKRVAAGIDHINSQIPQTSRRGKRK